ncbi:AAA family ATPase [bacterium]|nr:AAA family ATPase [bacterium]
MLESLRLRNVGPAPEMELSLGPRLNLITGDNGLGKSFLLDLAWWALTRKWPHDLNSALTSGYAARPTDPKSPAVIELKVRGKAGRLVDYKSEYNALEQAWRGKAGRPWNPGLVLYALADGAFAVWDPHRNYWRTDRDADVQERLPAYVFSSQEVWDGLQVDIQGRSTRVCNGLLADWASWIRERGPDAHRMAAVLEGLGPHVGEEPLRPGAGFARLSVNDARDIPTISMSYAPSVPILHASLGIRRITALAYMMCWAWREHRIAADQLGETASSRVVVLFDEIEAHLHPRWQRIIVPALLKVVQTLTEDQSASIQLIAATHSPLVLASVEPHFDENQDRLFGLGLDAGQVTLQPQPWAKQGDVLNWLVSESFGLTQARSVEGERAIEAAEAWMRGDPPAPPFETMENIHRELLRVLPGHDPFWPRWIVRWEEPRS